MTVPIYGCELCRDEGRNCNWTVLIDPSGAVVVVEVKHGLGLFCEPGVARAHAYDLQVARRTGIRGRKYDTVIIDEFR